jgi:hypothetical protein
MSSPRFMFVNLVISNVEILKFGTLEGWEFSDLVACCFEFAEIWEVLFLGEDVQVFDLVVGELETEDLFEIGEDCDVDDRVVCHIDVSDEVYFIHVLSERLDTSGLEEKRIALEALSVVSPG